MIEFLGDHAFVYLSEVNVGGWGRKDRLHRSRLQVGGCQNQ
jgi:hypothetical protein